MKKFILSVAMAAVALTAMPSAALAQDNNRDERGSRHDGGDQNGNSRHNGGDQNGNYRANRRGENRDHRRAQRETWQNYNRYDYNRADPRYGNYSADRYYRDGQYYQPRRLSYNDRVYRGQNGQYYCRRSDGTTGLIIGGAVGGLLGNSIARGGSKTVGTIIGAGAGALLGREVERGGVKCG